MRVVPWRSGCNAHAAAAAAYRCLATQHHNITTLAVVTLVPARRGAQGLRLYADVYTRGV